MEVMTALIQVLMKYFLHTMIQNPEEGGTDHIFRNLWLERGRKADPTIQQN